MEHCHRSSTNFLSLRLKQVLVYPRWGRFNYLVSTLKWIVKILKILFRQFKQQHNELNIVYHSWVFNFTPLVNVNFFNQDKILLITFCRFLSKEKLKRSKTNQERIRIQTSQSLFRVIIILLCNYFSDILLICSIYLSTRII